jgi:hypothetical protein
MLTLDSDRLAISTSLSTIDDQAGVLQDDNLKSSVCLFVILYHAVRGPNMCYPLSLLSSVVHGRLLIARFPANISHCSAAYRASSVPARLFCLMSFSGILASSQLCRKSMSIFQLVSTARTANDGRPAPRNVHRFAIPVETCAAKRRYLAELKAGSLGDFLCWIWFCFLLFKLFLVRPHPVKVQAPDAQSLSRGVSHGHDTIRLPVKLSEPCSGIFHDVRVDDQRTICTRIWS